MPTDADTPTFVPDDRFIAAVRDGVNAHRRRNRRRATSVLALVAVLAGSGVWYANDHLSSVQRIDLGTPTTEGPDPVVGTAPFNVLFVGTDGCTPLADDDVPICKGRPANENLFDAISVLRVDPSHHTIDMVSFPRDLWIEDYDTKLNSLSLPEIAAYLDATFGLHIDHAAGITMTGFAQIAGHVGVRLDPASDIRDRMTGLSLDAGCQTVDGSQLLALVRARHLEFRSESGWMSDPTSDLGRIERRSIVVKAALDQLGGTSTSLSLINDVAGVLEESGLVDSGMSNADLVEFGKLMATSTIRSMATVPTLAGGHQNLSTQELASADAVNAVLIAVGGHYEPRATAPGSSTEPTIDPALQQFVAAMPIWDDIAAC